MTSQRLKGTAFAFLLAAGTLFGGSVLAADVQHQEQEQAEESIPLEEIGLFADIFGTIKNYYVDEVPSKDLIENAIRGMVEGLDPHSSYLDFNALKDMEESTMGEFGGLGLEVTKDAQGVRVVNPIDDTPAAKAGVMAGDLIVKIDGKSTADLSLNENVKLMRGKPKTPITLTIARKGVAKPIVIKLVRDIIKIQSVKSKSLGDGLAYIRISQFQERTATDVADAIVDAAASKGSIFQYIFLRFPIFCKEIQCQRFRSAIYKSNGFFHGSNGQYRQKRSKDFFLHDCVILCHLIHNSRGNP